MNDWFDPQTWMRQIPDPLNVRGMFQEGTKAWLNELASLGHNRPIEVRGRRPLTGTIRSIKLYPTAVPTSLLSGDPSVDALDRAVVVIDEIEWDGRVVDRIDVVVDDVRFGSRPRSHLAGGPVTLQATIPLETASEWLAESRIIVEDVNDDGEIRVRYRWWKLPFVADVVPGVTASAGVLTIKRLWLWGKVVPLPKRFDLSLTVNLDLRDGVRMREARLVDGHTIAVEAQMLEVDYPIGIQQILEWFRQGGDRSVIDVATDSNDQGID